MIRLRDTLARSHRTNWERSIQRRLLDQELELVPPGDLTPEPAADTAESETSASSITTKDESLSTLDATGADQGFGSDAPMTAVAEEE